VIRVRKASLILRLLVTPVADGIFNDIMYSPDAWQVVTDEGDSRQIDEAVELRPTTSSRKVKSLIEQVTGASELFHNHTPGLTLY
jgi:hypothetical protein